MDRTPAKIHERIRVGGIKLSPELVQFSCNYTSATDSCLATALKVIAGQQINVTFLSLSSSSDTLSMSLCVALENHIIVRQILESAFADVGRLQCIDSVGTLTVFPHRNSLALLGRIVGAFAVNSLPVYGICTSISALSVNTRYSSLMQAVTTLRDIVDLPENHSPFRQEFIIRQINLHSRCSER